jgi:hypothetical protein
MRLLGVARHPCRALAARHQREHQRPAPPIPPQGWRPPSIRPGRAGRHRRQAQRPSSTNSRLFKTPSQALAEALHCTDPMRPATIQQQRPSRPPAARRSLYQRPPLQATSWSAANAPRSSPSDPGRTGGVVRARRARTSAAESTETARELYDQVLALYPGRVNPGHALVVGACAQARTLKTFAFQ